ncbi:MAG: M23 family metallopeptidase, partial [Candidatus Aminicenantes bacterium]|nr:M23 family metallopeptidase [Candidatus Aminicenantes bacterium]
SRASVQRVTESEIGGRTIWLYDTKRSLNMYFAHLQTQDVTEATIIEAGQTIGTIGNSGNARTTPPHLHFGIYVRGEGPVDPFHFINRIDNHLSPIRADQNNVGQWVRLKAPARLRSTIRNGGEPVAALNTACPLQVMAASGRSYRVRLPDGRAGYIPADQVEMVEKPIRNLTPVVSGPLLASPEAGAAEKASVFNGEELGILAVYEGYWLVETEEGLTGWIPVPVAAESDVL